ncbi:MAG: carboxypeptidase regulatory-like domain-containing protein [Sedimentisphaerales bacterium]|nr:carboxypeptidase regulatory-like domain-containing protein [Sedimentisphaerales bacterium]
MSNTKTIIVGVAAFVGGSMLMLGFVLGYMAGRVNKADKADIEQLPGKVAVSEEDKSGTMNEASTEVFPAKAPVSAEDESRAVYSGTVTDVDGNAIEGANLHILGHYGIKTASGQQGGYKISLDISTVYESHRDIWIIARHEGKNLASATRVGPETRTQDITLLPAVNATGKITDADGKPIPNATVYFGFDAAKGYITSFADRSRFAADSRGIYKVPFIPPENLYSVSFGADGYGSRKISVNTEDAVDGVLDLGSAVLLKADQKISGIVVGPDGKGVANVQVFRKSQGQPVGYKKTDDEGRFTLNVCKGEVALSAVIRREDGVLLAGRAKVASGTEDVRIVLEPREDRGEAKPQTK